MKRPVDRVRLEAVGGKTFDAFTSLEITNDLTAPAEASFECGDDGTWASLKEYLAIGARFRVVVNDRLRMTGRIEADDCPVDASNGATVRCLLRTKLSDATYASADPGVSASAKTLIELIEWAYLPLGYEHGDFIFNADVSRDIMTGKSSRGGKDVELSPITVEEARVNPPETIYEFVERHLLRFHLTHWDSPDGKIVVGAPNDEQAPLYRFVCKRGSQGKANNIISARRVRDASDAPSVIIVSGAYQATEFAKAKIARAFDVPEIQQAKLYRPVLFVDHSIQSVTQAEARAKREKVNRIKKLDSWEISADGWSFWNGSTTIPYGIDTVADVDVDVAGGSSGAYLVHRVHLARSADQGDMVSLSLIRKGLWVL